MSQYLGMGLVEGPASIEQSMINVDFTIEIGIGKLVNGFNVLDGFGGSLVAGCFQLLFSLGPVFAFEYLVLHLQINIISKLWQILIKWAFNDVWFVIGLSKLFKNAIDDGSASS